MKNPRFLVSILTLLMMGGSGVFAKEFQAQVIDLGPVSTVYSNLIKAIGEETGNTFKITVVPRVRALAALEKGSADVVLPLSLVGAEGRAGNMSFDVALTVYDVCYVLYSTKNTVVTPEELKKGNASHWVVEADQVFSDAFEFKVKAATSFDGAFKRVDVGTSDGFLFAQPSGDALLKKLGLTNIKRTLYASYPVVIAVPKGQKGGGFDQVLQDGIKRLKANGRFESIMGGLIKNGSVFNDWQP